MVQNFVHGRGGELHLVAQGEELLPPGFRQPLCLSRIVVGDGQHANTALRHVAPGETVPERERQNALFPFGGDHLVDKAPHRLERRQVHADHAAIEEGHGGFDAPLNSRYRQLEEFACPHGHIGMGILLVDDDQV